MELGFEHQPFGICEIELGDGNYFTRALPYAHIADREFPWIPPIGIKGTILFVSRNFHKRLDHRAAFLLSNALDEILKTLRTVAFADVSAGDGLNHFRNLLGRNCADRKPICACILLPFSAQHDLEVRDLAIGNRPARSIETEIRNVMLAA